LLENEKEIPYLTKITARGRKKIQMKDMSEEDAYMGM